MVYILGIFLGILGVVALGLLINIARDCYRYGMRNCYNQWLSCNRSNTPDLEKTLKE
jgi:hypothetical protein